MRISTLGKSWKKPISNTIQAKFEIIFHIADEKKSKFTVENLAFGFPRMVIRIYVSSLFNNQVLKK